jgi:hypothetical protein
MANFSALDSLQHVVYERTQHNFEIAPDEGVDISRTNIFPDGSAFLLHNFITPNEIEQIKAQSESFGLSDSGYPHSYRICDKVSAKCGEFGHVLFDRVRPHISEVFITDSTRPNGVADHTPAGIWQAYGLNPCFRVVRYSPGGKFFPHQDGGFHISKSNTSIKTLMIYLNDGFEGGCTSFYDMNSGIIPYEAPDPSLAIHVYQPRAGDCLIFNHALLHDGGILESGEKWICRSEVMYEHTGKYR